MTTPASPTLEGPYYLTAPLPLEDPAQSTRFNGTAYSGAVINDFGERIVVDLTTTRIAPPLPLLHEHQRALTIGTISEAENSGQALTVAGELFADIDDTAKTIAAKAQAPAHLFSERATGAINPGERDARLVQAGVLRLTEQYHLGAYDYDAGDFEIPAAAPPPSIPATLRAGAGSGMAPGVRLAANGQRFSADQELVEALVDNTLREAASPIPAEQIAKVIRNAKGPDDLAERLAKLYTGSDAAAFRELVERSLYAADVLGYVTAEKRIGAEQVE